MPPLSNLAVRDVETLVHPYVNLASFRESGPPVSYTHLDVYKRQREAEASRDDVCTKAWCLAQLLPSTSTVTCARPENPSA